LKPVIAQCKLRGVIVPTAPVLAGFGIGLALGGAPGPVQAVLLSESLQGLGRGFQALAGANLIFGFLLLASAAGLSQLVPTGLQMRGLALAGGGVLLWLAVDGLRHASRPIGGSAVASTVPPFVRGATIVLLNPGGWLFLATVGTAIFTSARLAGGPALAVISAVAMIGGLAAGDAGVVLLGGWGLRRARAGLRSWIQRGLAAILGGFGCWLLVRAVAAP
jgi:threonine/homoserine/homoserine lactone efflux protein